MFKILFVAVGQSCDLDVDSIRGHSFLGVLMDGDIDLDDVVDMNAAIDVDDVVDLNPCDEGDDTIVLAKMATYTQGQQRKTFEVKQKQICHQF